MTARIVAAALACALLTACGSTAQQQSATGLAPAAGGDGLSPGGDPSGVGGPSLGAGEDGAPVALGPDGAVVPGSPAGDGATAVADGTAATGTAAPGTAVRSGGTGPVKVGIVQTAVPAEEFGISFGNTVSERQVYDAVVKSLNAEGGLAGRRIEPVYASTSTGSSNWEDDFSRACATFTQDNLVDVVVGYVFNHYASFESCLAKKQIPHFNTGFNIPDEQELRNYPLYLAVGVPSIGRRSLAKIDGAVATAVLTRTSRVGLANDNCPGTRRSRDAVAVPALKRAGITVVRTFEVDCVQGYSDAGTASAQMQSMVLAFASERVDTVLFHSVSEGPSLLQFAITAESQEYRPTYVMSSLANLSVLAEQDQMPREQLRNVKAFGWMPNQDIAPRQYSPPNAPQKRCLALLKKQGVVPVAAVDYGFAYNICEVLFLYEKGLERSGGAKTGPPLVRAIHTLGESFVSSMNLDGRSVYGTGRQDAVAAARPLVYRDECGCFQYTGSIRPIPMP